MQDGSSEAPSALTQLLVADASMGDTLDRVVVLSNEAVKGASFAGLAMLDDQGRASTAVFTDKEAPRIDQAQYETGREPCLDAGAAFEMLRRASQRENVKLRTIAQRIVDRTSP